METTERVEQLLAPLLAAQGLEVVDVELRGGILRISVDRDGGIDIEAIGEATQTISDALDAAEADGPEIVPGRYTLEVSSPGVERPLRTPAHFRRFVGTTVNVRTQPGVDGDRRLQGPLDAADDDGIVVAGRRIAYGDIERARTVFEWGPTPKRGGSSSPKPSQKKAASS